MTSSIDQVQQALREAQEALQRGDQRTARHWAEQAVNLAPDQEAPWLMLAALASPQASLEYIKHALEINPQSQRARQAMHWAIQRYRANPSIQPAPKRKAIVQASPSEAFIQPRPAYWVWAVLLLLVICGIAAWMGFPAVSQALQIPQPQALAQVITGTTPSSTPTNTSSPTWTPAPTDTNTPLPSPTVEPTATNTPPPTDTATLAPTDTPTATLEPTATATDHPKNSKKRKAAKVAAGAPDAGYRPAQVSAGERWIDVDLSQQTTYAYEGDNIVASFLVSTGTWIHPTVTGQFQIYVKYRSASMSGPDYYLPNVPYIMYFYKGYGLHGTYWHNNFGTPMSHGCVNLRTEDAGWLFNWASVGTVVNVHP